MKYFIILLAGLVFVSCNGVRMSQKNIDKNPNMDGEYHTFNPKGGIAPVPYFVIKNGEYCYYPAGLDTTPFYGRITELPNNHYLFNSQFQNAKFNYEKKAAGISDSVILNIKIFAGLDTLGSPLMALLENGDSIPLFYTGDRMHPIRVSSLLANQITCIYSDYYGYWKVQNITEFESGNQYDIFLLDGNYFVMTNEKFRLLNDTLYWVMTMGNDIIEVPFFKVAQ